MQKLEEGHLFGHLIYPIAPYSEIIGKQCQDSTYKYTLSISKKDYAINQLVKYDDIGCTKEQLVQYTINTDYCLWVRIYANKVQAKVAPAFCIDPSLEACPANIGVYFDFRVAYTGGGTNIGQDNVYIYQYAGDTGWTNTGYTYGAQYYVSFVNMISQIDGYNGTTYYQLGPAQSYNDLLGPILPEDKDNPGLANPL